MTDSPRRWRSSWIIDALVVVAVFAAAAIVAMRFLSASRTRAFVEWETTPAVMIACGRGFTTPASDSPALVDFFMRRRPAMSCADIGDDRPGMPPVRIALSERYGVYGAALALRAGGLSWRALDAYVGCLFGLSMVLSYLLFRLAAGRVPALLGVIALVCSGHLLGLLTFRDYGKEPCFLALWLTLGWLWRRGAAGVSRRLLLPAGVGGAVLGLGVGFRPDILVGAPALAAVIALAVRGFSRDDLRIKAAALAAATLAFVVAGGPVLSGMAAGGNNSSHVMILGLTTSFNRTLDLEPAPYDIGDMYSDGFVYTVIAAHAALVQHEPQPVIFSSARYDVLGLELLADVARHFPADMVIRALAATVQVLRYPFDPIARFDDLSTQPFVDLRRLEKAAQMVGTALNWVQPWALWLPLAVLVVASMRDWRMGLWGGMLVLYFCGYSMLQFSRRHTFHLDVIPIGILVVALDLTIGFGRRVFDRLFRIEKPKAPAHARTGSATPLAGLLVVASSIAVIVLTLSATRIWQQRHVIALLDQTLGVSWETVPTTPEPLSASILRDGLPMPGWEVAYAAHPDQWRTGVLLRIPLPALSPEDAGTRYDIVDTSYLQVEIDDTRCRVPTVLIGTKYTEFAETANREFTRVFEIGRGASGHLTRVLVPVFYVHGPAWTHFDGLAVPVDAQPCLSTVRRAIPTDAVPLPILVAVLTPGWKTRALYQQMKHMPGLTHLP